MCRRGALLNTSANLLSQILAAFVAQSFIAVIGSFYTAYLGLIIGLRREQDKAGQTGLSQRRFVPFFLSHFLGTIVPKLRRLVAGRLFSYTGSQAGLV